MKQIKINENDVYDLMNTISTHFMETTETCVCDDDLDEIDRVILEFFRGYNLEV